MTLERFKSLRVNANVPIEDIILQERYGINPELDNISSKDLEPRFEKLIDESFWELTDLRR